MNTKMICLIAFIALQVPLAHASKDYYDFRWELKQLEEKQRDPSQDDQPTKKEKMKIKNDPLMLETEKEKPQKR